MLNVERLSVYEIWRDASRPVGDDEYAVRCLLYALEHGWITCALVGLNEPHAWAVYQVSNGWRITVFNDGGEFDYIESVTTPDGRNITSFDGCVAGDFGPLLSYQPSEDSLATVWKWNQ